jgi:hypothetical protein
MARLHRLGDLDVAQDPAFTRREWMVQRVAWAASLLVLLAALCGLLGDGPASRASVSAGELRVEYERFTRRLATADLVVRVGDTSADAERRGHPERRGVWLDADYVEAVEVQRVTPTPGQVVSSGDRVVYLFVVETGPEAKAPSVAFALRPRRAGMQHARVGLVDGPAVTLRQVVYP